MPSFDVVLEVNKVELVNSIDQTNKEISNRFDFKGSDARVEYKELDLTLFADDEFKLQQLKDVLFAKCAKRGIDVRFLEFQKQEKISGNKLKENVKIKQGVNQELGKKIIKLIKDNKLKVQASIQGDVIRVTGNKRDDLQSTIQLIRQNVVEVPLDFNNFRD